MLDFIAVPVPVSRQRFVLYPLLVTAYAVSCAVFPDEAVLPAVGNTDLGGAGSSEAAGATAAAGEPMTSTGGAAQTGGVGGLADAGNGGVGGSAGAAGEGGASEATCESPQQTVVVVDEDTWIDAAKPATSHGNDTQLWVEPGENERRALLRVDLPAASSGAWLTRATLILNLESNADPDLAERWFGLYVLSKPFDEGKTTWVQFDNTDNDWASPGGDFGDIVASGQLEAGSAQGSLTFDVTKPLAAVYGTQPVPVGLILIDIGTPALASAELAFTSAEGDASRPSLVIESCEP